MRRSAILAASLFVVLPLLFAGCGDDNTTILSSGAAPGTAAPVNLESCSICHDDVTVRNGDAHQADYDQRFQDGVIVVTNIDYAFNPADNTHNVTFELTKNGLPFDCEQITTGAPDDSLSIGFAEYNAATGTFDPPAPLDNTRMSLGSQRTLSYDPATNLCTSTVKDNTVENSVVTPVGDLSTRNGIIEINGRDDRQGTLPSPSRVQLALFPFAGLLELGTVDYVSAATVDGCQKCHTVPYLKHGFIYGRVDGDPNTDFYTCKGCHMDNSPGSHFIWQVLVDNPALSGSLYAQWIAEGRPNKDLEAYMTSAQKAQYAYKTSLMNDVHMSHAMEFAYPQSMSNCVTCHAGKLNLILTDANFTIETCKSCHPVNGGTDAQNGVDSQGRPVFRVDTRAGSTINKQAPALVGLLPLAGAIPAHNPPFATACNSCHNGTVLPQLTFSQIHTGYDTVIYGNATGTKYSTAITVTIDNASFNDNTNVLSFGFHATGSLGTANSVNIVPTVLVGLYGFDTKDFLHGPHERHFDSNGDGVVNSSDRRDLEAVAGQSHPRITITSPSAGSWNVTANLSNWAAWIDNGSVKRAEVGVIPTLRRNPPTDNAVVALNAPSKTFVLGTNLFDNTFFAPIVRVQEGSVGGNVSGCNNCHEALATTFHSPDRGGNVVMCRLCHTTKSPGSHLELQSRSIDSYAHAIHRFQVLDIGDIDFSDPVEALHYEHHVESNFPTFGIENCRACHNAGVFNVPNQARSLPGVLSASDVAVISNIPLLPEFITGPAVRACGACHRAEAIIANAGQGDPVKLNNLNSHMSTFGYMVPTSATTREDDLYDIIFQLGFGTIL